MKGIWCNCTGFRLLEVFLKEPGKAFTLRETARAAGLSPSAAKKYCDQYEKEGFLAEKKVGTARLFSLVNSFFLVRQSKALYLLSKIREAGIEKACTNPISIAVYGSTVSGDYDENSDMDILMIGGKLEDGAISAIQKKIGKDLQITHLSLSAWSKKKESRDPFAMQVLMRHVLVSGEPL
jgi:predicted nucleotidyltransferase